MAKAPNQFAPSESAVASQLTSILNAGANGPNSEFVELPRRILGGFDAFTYSFELAENALDLNGPLILRVFPQAGERARSRREMAFQNALNDLGYPVPRVLFQADDGIDGLTFIVMERVPGAPMLAGMAFDEQSIHKMATQLGRIHAQLHMIPVDPVVNALTKAGLDPSEFSSSRQLTLMARYFEDGGFDWLRPGYEWLIENWRDEETTCVCHGDFHPANIMVEGNDVTGVIDWSGAALAAAEYDVGTSIVLIKVAAGAAYPDARPMLELFARDYLASYQSHAQLDLRRVDYYVAMRCLRAFTRGTALHVPKTRSELLPRDGYPWAHDSAMRAAQLELERVIGLILPLPSERP